MAVFRWIAAEPDPSRAVGHGAPILLGRRGHLIVDDLRHRLRRLFTLIILGDDVYVRLPDWSRFVFGDLLWCPVPAHRMWVGLGRFSWIAHEPSWLVWRTSAAVSIKHTTPSRPRAFVKSRNSPFFERGLDVHPVVKGKRNPARASCGRVDPAHRPPSAADDRSDPDSHACIAARTTPVAFPTAMRTGKNRVSSRVAGRPSLRTRFKRDTRSNLQGRDNS